MLLYIKYHAILISFDIPSNFTKYNIDHIFKFGDRRVRKTCIKSHQFSFNYII